MRTPVIAGNWKMYKDATEALIAAAFIQDGVSNINNVEIIVAPPAIDIYGIRAAFASGLVGIAAQNCHWEKEGAFTGEISVPMIVAAGCRYVIIGHSERRKHFGETDETVNLKVKACIDSGLVPIICVGETGDQRAEGRTIEVVYGQISRALLGIEGAVVCQTIIAYEPVWAIGTGVTASPEHAQEVHGIIRSFLTKRYSTDLACSLRLIYGGSVKPENISDLLRQDDIDGALIGNASLDAKSFAEMVRIASEMYAE